MPELNQPFCSCCELFVTFLYFFLILLTLFVPFLCLCVFPLLSSSLVLLCSCIGSAAELELPALLNAAGNLCFFLYLTLRGIGETFYYLSCFIYLCSHLCVCCLHRTGKKEKAPSPRRRFQRAAVSLSLILKGEKTRKMRGRRREERRDFEEWEEKKGRKLSENEHLKRRRGRKDFGEP